MRATVLGGCDREGQTHSVTGLHMSLWGVDMGWHCSALVKLHFWKAALCRGGGLLAESVWRTQEEGDAASP